MLQRLRRRPGRVVASGAAFRSCGKATFLSFTSSAVDVASVWDQRRADLSQCTWEKEVKDLI